MVTGSGALLKVKGGHVVWRVVKVTCTDLKVKNWKETVKDRNTWRDLAEKAKTHKGL